MKDSLPLLLLAALLSVVVKYGLAGIPIQPTPAVLMLLVAGPAGGMALWLIWSRPLKTVKIDVQNEEKENHESC
ncbi:MAG: hypothetical protein Q6K99_08415 [Thermostichales cyanobacterium BF4_bins_65]